MTVYSTSCKQIESIYYKVFELVPLGIVFFAGKQIIQEYITKYDSINPSLLYRCVLSPIHLQSQLYRSITIKADNQNLHVTSHLKCVKNYFTRNELKKNILNKEMNIIFLFLKFIHMWGLDIYQVAKQLTTKP